MLDTEMHTNLEGDTMTLPKLVEFKGNREGIYLQLQPDVPLDAILEQLRLRLAQGAGFFVGAKFIGIVGQEMENDDVERIRGVINGEFGLDMVDKPVRKSPKLIFDLEVPESAAPVEAEVQTLGDTVFHRGNLRSGRRVQSAGHLIIMGDVNPGAELVAEGNIVVMGILRGIAHAGCSGNENAFVTATKLEPMQLRIASKITRSPDDGYEDPEYPEIALIRDGNIVIEPNL